MSRTARVTGSRVPVSGEIHGRGSSPRHGFPYPDERLRNRRFTHESPTSSCVRGRETSDPKT